MKNLQMDFKKKRYGTICVLDFSFTVIHTNWEILRILGVLWDWWGYLGDIAAQTREVTGELKGLDRSHKYLSGKTGKTEQELMYGVR